MRHSSIIIIRIITFLSWMCIVPGASAVTYFVSPTGSDGNTGSEQEPLKTIQEAAKKIKPGDTVIVRDGVYTVKNKGTFLVNINNGGTADRWITFRSEHKWGAKLDGQNNTAEFCWNFGKRANYIRVEGFEVYGCKKGGFWSNAGAHDIYIYGNNIHDIGRQCVDPAETSYGQAGVYQGSESAYHTYDSNVVHHIGRLNCGYAHDYNHDHGLYLKGYLGKVINNVFYNNNSGWSIAITGGKKIDSGSDWLISNNTFSGKNPDRDGHILLSKTVLTIVPSKIVIQNNISYGQDSYMIHVLSPLSGRLKDILIRNNITTTPAVISPGYWGVITLKDNITNTDPKFADQVHCDFHLQPASPAIHKGLREGCPPYDIDRKSRPHAGWCDIGAYEASD